MASVTELETFLAYVYASFHASSERIIAIMILASFDNQVARRHFWSVLLFKLESFKNRVKY